MSSKKRSQHFVPRHYLRRFCFDDGNRIRILTIKDGSYIPEGGLKGQCAKPHFYHIDPRIEDALTEFEGRAEQHLKKIVDEHWLPTDGPDRNDILSILNLMRSRTEMFADQTFKIPETGMLESARILAEANNNPELLKVLPNLRVRASNWPMHGVRFGLTSVILLSDLRLTLLVPPSGAHFITSDHPVILLNQAFVNILRDQSAGGLAMRGVQLFLPLSPDLLLLAFDPVCYRVGQPNRRLVHITRKEDVDLINALQILNANQCLYFRDEEDEPLFRNLLFKFQNKRPDPQKLVEKHEITEDGQKGSLIACYAPSIPLPGIWSFCKTRYQFSGQNYVPRNEYLCHLHREYQKDCQKHGTLLPLSKWLADKTAEREKR